MANNEQQSGVIIDNPRFSKKLQQGVVELLPGLPNLAAQCRMKCRGIGRGGAAIAGGLCKLCHVLLTRIRRLK